MTQEALDAIDAAFADYFCVMTVRSGGEVRRSSALALWAGLHARTTSTTSPRGS
jgi:hypothetical protein